MDPLEYCTYRVLRLCYPTSDLQREKYIIYDDIGRATTPDFFWFDDRYPISVILEVTGVSVHNPQVWMADQSAFAHKMNKHKQMEILTLFCDTYPQFQPLIWFGEGLTSEYNIIALLDIFNQLASGHISGETAQDMSDDIAFGGSWRHTSAVNWEQIFFGVQDIIQQNQYTDYSDSMGF